MQLFIQNTYLTIKLSEQVKLLCHQEDIFMKSDKALILVTHC